MTDDNTETVYLCKGYYTDVDIPSIRGIGDYSAMEFTANLRRLRKQRKWTQGQVAERLGVQQPTYQRWETGAREPAFSEIKSIAEAFEVSVSDLFHDNLDDRLPSADDLSRMIQRAMNELPVGVSFSDYPTAVAASLHEQLTLFRSAGSSRCAEDEVTAPGTSDQSRAPTSGDEQAVSRNS